MAGNAGCLSLYSLCPSYLQALGGGVAVECHVLCFEGRGMITVLPEDAAEGGSYDTFADITACSCEHNGV